MVDVEHQRPNKLSHLRYLEEAVVMCACRHNNAQNCNVSIAKQIKTLLETCFCIIPQWKVAVLVLHLKAIISPLFILPPYCYAHLLHVLRLILNYHLTLNLSEGERESETEARKCENDTERLNERDRDPTQIAFTDLPHWICPPLWWWVASN